MIDIHTGGICSKAYGGTVKKEKTLVEFINQGVQVSTFTSLELVIEVSSLSQIGCEYWR